MEIQQQADFIRPVSLTAETTGNTTTVTDEAQASSGEFFVSPFLRFDPRSLTVIFQIRDTRSGDVTLQFPPERAVEQYRQDPSARPFVLPQEAREDAPDSQTEAAPNPAGADSEGAVRDVTDQTGAVDLTA